MKILGFLTARGWAIGGALAGGIVALLSPPPYLLVNQGWFPVLAFGLAAVLMGVLAVFPWSDALRQVAVTVFLFACLARAFGLAFLGEGPLDARLIGATAWSLVAFFGLLLSVQTIEAGHRARK